MLIRFLCWYGHRRSSQYKARFPQFLRRPPGSATSPLTRLLDEFPGPDSRFITWTLASQCANANYSAALWGLRKSCISSIVKLAVCLDRHVLLTDEVSAQYDMTQLRAWFPVVPASLFTVAVAPGLQTSDVQRHDVHSPLQQGNGALPSSNAVSLKPFAKFSDCHALKLLCC